MRCDWLKRSRTARRVAGRHRDPRHRVGLMGHPHQQRQVQSAVDLGAEVGGQDAHFAGRITIHQHRHVMVVDVVHHRLVGGERVERAEESRLLGDGDHAQHQPLRVLGAGQRFLGPRLPVDRRERLAARDRAGQRAQLVGQQLRRDLRHRLGVLIVIGLRLAAGNHAKRQSERHGGKRHVRR